jgi:predicted acylesterase/phospholipase RssA
MAYDTLVLSGGSTSGLTILGKLFSISLDSPLRFECYAGSSIGSVIAFLLLIDYCPEEIAYYLYNSTVWDELLKFNLLRTIRGKGIFSLELLKKELESIILQKMDHVPTFGELEKSFLCCAYNLTNKQMEYFTNYTCPEMNVLDALIMSCAIPLLFEPIVYNNCKYIDGGIVDNFPILKTVYYFGSKSVLGIICVKSKEAKNIDAVWSVNDIMPILFATSTHYTEEQIYNARLDVQLDIVKVSSSIPFYDLRLNKEKICQMLSAGFD